MLLLCSGPVVCRSFFLSFFSTFFFSPCHNIIYHIYFHPQCMPSNEWIRNSVFCILYSVYLVCYALFQHRPTQITLGKSAYSKLVCKLYLRIYPVMWTNWCALLHISIDYFELNEQSALSKHRQSTSTHTHMHTHSTTCTSMYRNQLLFSQMGIMKLRTQKPNKKTKTLE